MKKKMLSPILCSLWKNASEKSTPDFVLFRRGQDGPSATCAEVKSIDQDIQEQYYTTLSNSKYFKGNSSGNYKNCRQINMLPKTYFLFFIRMHDLQPEPAYHLMSQFLLINYRFESFQLIKTNECLILSIELTLVTKIAWELCPIC